MVALPVDAHRCQFLVVTSGCQHKHFSIARDRSLRPSCCTEKSIKHVFWECRAHLQTCKDMCRAHLMSNCPCRLVESKMRNCYGTSWRLAQPTDFSLFLPVIVRCIFFFFILNFHISCSSLSRSCFFFCSFFSLFYLFRVFIFC